MSLDCIISLVFDLIFIVLYSDMWYRPVAWEQEAVQCSLGEQWTISSGFVQEFAQ